MIFVPKKEARKIKKRLLEESQIRLKKQIDEAFKEWENTEKSNWNTKRLKQGETHAIRTEEKSKKNMQKTYRRKPNWTKKRNGRSLRRIQKIKKQHTITQPPNFSKKRTFKTQVKHMIFVPKKKQDESEEE